VLMILIESLPSYAGPIDARFYETLRWRMIGPFRGGRTVAAAGVPGRPNLFYVAASNGGVWKTNDYGRTWRPIFDDQPTGSVGALAVAPSKPDTIYVGSGEGLQRPDLSTGDGIYKSTDGGKSWKHLGLRDGQQIGAILVHPANPERLLVAVLGHPYGANAERGVFRSVNGGATWQKVLYKEENTGAIALAFAPDNPEIIYADLWSSRQGPWENGAWQGRGSGLYKSSDGGTTWRQLTKGLPSAGQKLGRIGFDVARSDPRRMYALVDAPKHGGVYRSDDAGESWQRVNTEIRLWGRGSDFAEIKVDPKNRDVLYIANTSTYRSRDGGQSFTAIKGAPGGDDYHTIWINPENPEIILLASDQGAVVSVNGGETWSSWYNQPTAQFYHVITDNQFPYWVYGGQQESGSAGVASRGDWGEITAQDWRTVGVEEYGYVAPDPLNPDLIYGGKVTRYDRRTGQVQNVAPEAIRSGKYRFLRTAPLIFSPVDPHILYLGSNVLFKTTTGGQSWDIISPDLTREHPEVPASIGIFRAPELAHMPRRGVIYTVAPSYRDQAVIWAGTDDGLIHLTRDGGKAWKNVTPPNLTSWSKISIIDAGRFDAPTAYVAVNRIRLDDQKPHIYRTHDWGQTWQEIVNGLPGDAPVNSVREDPERRGLLFVGTERAVHVSFNDGDDWQPLRLNMPATSIRDLVIHGDDVVAGTHGRSFWILDDITPLRQLRTEDLKRDVILFKPGAAYRIRRSVNTDTPLPPEEPTGQNPPDGAIFDYDLKGNESGPVALSIYDSRGDLVRRFSSADKPEPVNEKELDVPTYWIRPPRLLSAKAGMHRFVWNLHYPPPPGVPRSYPISAVYHDTPSEPLGPAVHPGNYTVKLEVDKMTFTQPLTVKMDPRVPATEHDLSKQHVFAMTAWQSLNRIHAALASAAKLHAQIETALKDTRAASLRHSLTALENHIAALAGEGTQRRRFAPEEPRDHRQARTLAMLQRELNQLLELVEEADAAPTPQADLAAAALQKELADRLHQWEDLRTNELARLNDALRKNKFNPLMP
jgi:photosystem II stability/assembly factor-like uncharacterized protein